MFNSRVPRRKYRNAPTTIGGIDFDSKAEAKRYGELLLMERAGKIRAVELQPKFSIAIKGKWVCNYFADFAYEQDGKIVVEDVKGVRTAVYNLKKRLVEAEYGVVITEIGGKRKKKPKAPAWLGGVGK